jgi:hypothetical protein
MIEILNINSKRFKSLTLIENTNYVFCGRPSKYGNPYPMKTEKDRQVVVDKFKKDIDNIDLSELVELAKENDILYLGCFCYPKLCHCEVIKEKIEEILEG